MGTVVVILLLAAFALCVARAFGKGPEWLPVMLVIIAELIRYLPAS
jgi:hypothetical protein